MKLLNAAFNISFICTLWLPPEPSNILPLCYFNRQKEVKEVKITIKEIQKEISKTKLDNLQTNEIKLPPHLYKKCGAQLMGEDKERPFRKGKS